MPRGDMIRPSGRRALRVSCNERETVQPANLNYTNFGRQMDAQLEWLDKD